MTNALPAAPVPLSPGVAIPQLGYGLYKVPAADAERLASHALDAGYRHLDTAAMYGNEEGVGAAVRRFGRDEVFVTSKVWNDDQGYDRTLRAFDASMERLGLDVLDLYLIHWPVAARGLFLDTYRALERLLSDGRVRAIGTSNFQIHHLEALMAETDVVPALNQVELHPWLQQRELRAFHAEHGIVTGAWSPLARGRLLDDPELSVLAAAHGVSVAQLVIRWHLQEGNVVIPKASSPERIRENADVFGFALTDADLAAVAAMDRGFRSGSHPDHVS